MALNTREDFPHLCPGKDCAICRWVDDREVRLAAHWWWIEQEERERDARMSTERNDRETCRNY